MKKYDNFCKALSNLQEGLKLEEPYGIVEQTGIVGLFDICFEQSWKMMKELLEKHGRFDAKTGSPRAIIKIAYQCNMVRNDELWLKLLEAGNVLAHTYSDEQALEVIRDVKSNYIHAFEALKQEVDENWMDVEKGSLL